MLHDDGDADVAAAAVTLVVVGFFCCSWHGNPPLNIMNLQYNAK